MLTRMTVHGSPRSSHATAPPSMMQDRDRSRDCCCRRTPAGFVPRLRLRLTGGAGLVIASPLSLPRHCRRRRIKPAGDRHRDTGRRSRARCFRATSAAGPTPQDRANRDRAVILASTQRDELGIDDGEAAPVTARAETDRAANPGRCEGCGVGHPDQSVLKPRYFG